MPEFNNPAWSEEKAELIYNMELARLDQDEDALRTYLRRLEELEEREEPAPSAPCECCGQPGGICARCGSFHIPRVDHSCEACYSPPPSE